MFKRLTIWLEQSPRWISVVIIHVILYSVYFFTNHYSFFEPLEMRPLPGEESIPFIGWTGLVYLTSFIQIPLAMFLYRPRDYPRMVYLTTGIVLVCALCFIFMPVVKPRLPEQQHLWLFQQFLRFDRPTNCFPSLHCAVSGFIALSFAWQGRRVWRWVFPFWSLAIAASTLTTGQHYVIDVFVGWGLAFAAYHFEMWRFWKMR